MRTFKTIVSTVIMSGCVVCACSDTAENSPGTTLGSGGSSATTTTNSNVGGYVYSSTALVTGGSPASGGIAAMGGASLPVGGATTASGGSNGTRTQPTGGNSSGGASGGSSSTGGKLGSGGTATGGKTAIGGRSGSGGVNTGGTFVAIGGAGTGGSTSATYRPCPTNGDPCKILPLGDSITWGLQYDGAYRVELFSKTVAAKQNITFTGSLSNGPAKVSNVTFPKSNEGHSGWTIAQISNQVPSPAFNTIPHIVLLLIGTNDVYASSGQATMPDRLGSLMDKIITAAPNALLVVAKITPLGTASFNATIKTYNDAIPELVQSRVAAGKHVMLADMNTGFTASMLSTDQVHPNQSGYDFMGDKWYELIGELLPQ